MIKITLTIFVFLLTAVNFSTEAYAANEGDKMPIKKIVFNIQLSAEAAELISDVEKGYGKSIREEEVASLVGFGESLIDDAGTPVIRINPKTGRTESTIVHEAFHLLLKLEGYPIFAYQFPNGQNTPANIEYMKWIRANLYDGILHWIFYPRMQKMGVDTNSEEKEQILKALRVDTYDNINHATEREALILYYIKAKLEINDTELSGRVTEWYKRKGWIEPLKMGDRIARLVMEANPQMPAASVSVFVDCINVLLHGSAKFEIDSWFTRSRGTIIEKGVLLQVLAPN